MFKLRRMGILTLVCLSLGSCTETSPIVNPPPAIPTNFSARAGDTEVTLSWRSNTEADLKGYQLRWGLSSGGLNQSSFIDKADTSYTLKNLKNGSPCYFALAAVDNAQNSSSQTAEISATPQAKADTTAPATPSGLNAEAGDSKVQLSWNANTELDLKSYTLYWGKRSTAFAHHKVIDKAAMSYTLNDLTNGETYYFALSAMDDSGNISPKSAEVSTTPVAAIKAGSLDTSFATNGKFTMNLGPTSRVENIAIQSDGKLVVVGNQAEQIVLLRLTPSGNLDPSFGTNGVLRSNLGDYAQARALTLTRDRGILVAGGTRQDGELDFLLLRYDGNGQLDTTFGDKGVVRTDFGGSDEAYAMALQADGKILVAGYSSTTSTDFAIARYQDDGNLDMSFATSGLLISDLGANDAVYSLLLQPDNKIIVASFGGVIARFSSSGKLDLSFSESGKVLVDSSFRTKLALQSDGKIIVAGAAVQSDLDFALYRLLPDASFDTSFATNGQAYSDFGKADRAYAVQVQEDGKIVVAGQTYDKAESDFALARYLPTGQLDSSFGTMGKVITDFGGYAVAKDLVFDTQGRIIVTGNTDSFALARYWP